MKIKSMLIITIVIFFHADIKAQLSFNHNMPARQEFPLRAFFTRQKNGFKACKWLRGDKLINVVMPPNEQRLERTNFMLFCSLCISLLILCSLGLNRHIKIGRLSAQLMIEKEEAIACTAFLNHMKSEKDWLIREIHHRVKNNLQVIMSLLNTQSNYLVNQEAVQALRNSHNRMYAIALVHKNLYQAESLSSINMEAYIEELARYLHDEYPTKQQISIILEITPIFIDIASAIPLGLIINEAISNALQHAFPQQNSGEIKLTLIADAYGNIVLRIADNGIGLPKELERSQVESLGAHLMKGLSQQMRAKLEIKSAEGVLISLFFKNDHMETYPFTFSTPKT